MAPWLAACLAAPAGLVLGSYAVTAGLRASRGEASAQGRSRCDACGVPLGFVQTIPVASFVVLRGACGVCRSRIDATHLAGELAGLAVAVSAFLTAPPERAAVMAGLGLLLVALSTVDFKIKRLPDALTAAVGGLGLLLCLMGGWDQVLEGVAAAAAAVACLSLVRMAFKTRSGDHGLGLGDVKLLAALALWLGVATPVALLAASVLGLGAARRLADGQGRIAFGPMLALCGWVVGLTMEGNWRPWEL